MQKTSQITESKTLKLKDDFSKTLALPLFKVIREAVASSGMESYVIGGFVRDHLLNRGQQKDIDIVTVGSGIELAYAVQKKLKGARPVQVFKTYGTAMIGWDEIDLSL